VAVSRNDLASLRGDLNLDILTFHVRAWRSRDSAIRRGEAVDVEEIEKETTPGGYIESGVWLIGTTIRRLLVDERWQNVKGRGKDEGSSVFGRLVGGC